MSKKKSPKNKPYLHDLTRKLFTVKSTVKPNRIHSFEVSSVELVFEVVLSFILGFWQIFANSKSAQIRTFYDLENNQVSLKIQVLKNIKINIMNANFGNTSELTCCHFKIIIEQVVRKL
jgi:hypothetical protein